MNTMFFSFHVACNSDILTHAQSGLFVSVFCSSDKFVAKKKKKNHGLLRRCFSASDQTQARAVIQLDFCRSVIQVIRSSLLSSHDTTFVSCLSLFHQTMTDEQISKFFLFLSFLQQQQQQQQWIRKKITTTCMADMEMHAYAVLDQQGLDRHCMLKDNLSKRDKS